MARHDLDRGGDADRRGAGPAARAARAAGTGLVILVVTLVLLEGAFVLRERLSAPDLIVRHPYLHHAWAPYADYRAEERGTEIELRTNAMGWVEAADVPEEKPPGVYRVFLVGDSNTQGVVADRFKWANLLEARLNEALPAFDRVEVVNTGTSSYSTVIYSVLIDRYLLAYEPDLVVVNVDVNDVRDDSAYRDQVVYEGERIVAVHNPWRTARSKLVLTPDGWRREERSRLYGWLATHSATMRFVDKYLGYLLARRDGIAEEALYRGANWHELVWTDEIRSNVDFSMRVIEGIVDNLLRNGVEVVVTGVPHLEQFEGSWSARGHEVLGETVRRAGGLYLDSFEAIGARGAEQGVDALYFDVDATHFNEAGNARFAEVHFDFLMRHRARLFDARARAAGVSGASGRGVARRPAPARE